MPDRIAVCVRGVSSRGRLGGGFDLPLQFGDVREMFDSFTQLSGDETHPLRELAGAEIGFAFGGGAERLRAAPIRVQRHGAERND